MLEPTAMNRSHVASRLAVITYLLLALPLLAQNEGQEGKADPSIASKQGEPQVAIVADVPDGAPQTPSILTASPSEPVSALRGGAVPVGASRYGLGPGDELNLSIYGKPALTKLNVPVAPDGTISYLQAKQVSVLGKTVDQVREELRDRLTSYHRDPLVMVAPAKLGSKTYTLLGEVIRNGSYPLTRPTTLLEALALAGGINVGSLGEDASELADLRRSFVVRNGRRLCVDLEALYLRGDFSQNITLQPNDYIHIASLVRNEIFVLGKVERPGVYPIRNGMTTMGAVAAAGGFSQVAWRNRVLVVRGKLNQPQCHVVQLNKTIHGLAGDMAIEPGDLIFVSLRPWAYAAQILDAALLAYIDGTVAGYLAEEGASIGFSVGPSL